MWLYAEYCLVLMYSISLIPFMPDITIWSMFRNQCFKVISLLKTARKDVMRLVAAHISLLCIFFFAVNSDLERKTWSIWIFSLNRQIIWFGTSAFLRSFHAVLFRCSPASVFLWCMEVKELSFVYMSVCGAECGVVPVCFAAVRCDRPGSSPWHPPLMSFPSFCGK